MNVCYKCRTPLTNQDKPGFNDVCEECGSYVHCCSNCKFYDEYSRPHCSEPNAGEALDPNGMNHCEYFQFRPAKGTPLDEPDDPELKRERRRPDWRNLRSNEKQRPRNKMSSGGRTSSGSGSETRAKKARQELDRLFGK